MWQELKSKSIADHRADFRARIHDADNAERARQGRPLRPSGAPNLRLAGEEQQDENTPPELVTVVDVNGYSQAWGFILFRTDYTNDKTWQTFEENFRSLVAKSIAVGKPGIAADIERIAPGKTVQIISHPSLQGASVVDVIR